MTDIILHHYEISPFSEKVRRLLAYKNVPWRAVEQPIMAPKPELTPLTGGYRRIPVMQMGADIYCDTALIVRRLEALHPTPAILPSDKAGAIALIEDWADHRLFMHAVPPTVSALVDALPPGFFADREAMTPAFTKDALIQGAPHALGQVRHSLDFLAAQLGADDYLLGAAFTLADAACYHCVNFLLNNPAMQTEIDARPALADWVQRIRDFGPGNVTPMSGADALSIARDSDPADIEGASVSADGYALGDVVTIIADDYGQETTTGKVVRILPNEITVVRDDADLGAIAVHYPRAGYRVSPA